MKNLLKNWARIAKGLRLRNVFLFLDYDGTLTPIVKRPSLAKMPEYNRELLKKLSKKPNFKIAVVSGRALKDVRRRVGVSKIIYSGNHGFETEGPGIRFKKPLKKTALKSMRIISRELKRAVSRFEGCLIEDKKYSISVHYRLAGKQDVEKIKKAVFCACRKYKKQKLVKVRPGKKVWEIKPAVDWNKGKIVKWLIKRDPRRNTVPIYFGDDITDNDAFRALSKRGITVFVGKYIKGIDAKYRLKYTGEVTRTLERMLTL